MRSLHEDLNFLISIKIDDIKPDFLYLEIDLDLV